MQAGESAGLYVVTAKCGDTEVQAQIRVQAQKPERKKNGDDGITDDHDEQYKEKVIRWTGTIPPQKWTTFYMKVVSPFASASGLTLRVQIEMPADKDEHQAKAQLEKIRSALRDLSLDEDIDFS